MVNPSNDKLGHIFSSIHKEFSPNSTMIFPVTAIKTHPLRFYRDTNVSLLDRSRL